jgi:hypothetical protein
MKMYKSWLHPRVAAVLVTAALSSSALPAAPTPADTQQPFPDFGFMVSPDGYSGPVFKLSQNYPTQPPGKDQLPAFFTQLPKTFSADFEQWRAYMMAIRDYCFEGNLPIDWRVEKNPVRPWYHIPWQHYGPAGREGIHGLTKEAAVQPKQLAATQGRPNPYDFYQTYAVGFFNEFGGYTIGQVWANHMKPDLSVTTKPNGFLEGTVISKLLFVDVPPEQAAFLANPQQWQAYIQAGYFNASRSVRSVTLIQMDIAVRDNRSPTGWLFGTFQYNGQLNQTPAWNNLVPVGIMWGNDPTITDNGYTNPQPTVTKINPNLKETAINANAKELPATHLGWNGRLNGPVDNPISSCMSCHMTAEVPTLSPLNPTFQANPPPMGSPAWMRWFADNACGHPFDAAAKSADFSLQLSIGVTNFIEWNVPLQSGLFAKDYSNPPAPPNGAKERLRSTNPPHAPGTFPIIRDLPPPTGNEK